MDVTAAVLKLCDQKPICSLNFYNNTLGKGLPCRVDSVQIDWKCQPLPLSIQPVPFAEEKNCSDCINFVAIGDYGGQSASPYYTSTQVATAAGMADLAAQVKSKFVLALGDNFYDVGVTNSTLFRFTSTWVNVFTQPPLQTNWYFVAGNHDWYGDVSAEINYARGVFTGKKWVFPSLNYDMVKTIPGSNRTAHFIFFDSYHLSIESHKGPVDYDWQRYCMAWLNYTLSNSYSHWKLLITHYPILSVVKHGPNPVISNLLQPLLEQYKVDFMICGHDHNSQHIIHPGTKGWAVNHFVVGGAHLDKVLLPSS